MRKSGGFEIKTTLGKTDDITQQSCPLISSVQDRTGRFFITKGITLGFWETAYLPLP